MGEFFIFRDKPPFPKEEVEKIPVHYCRDCLSLKIKTLKNIKQYSLHDIEYCDSCGSTEVGEMLIHDWEEVYKKKYGVSYLDNKNTFEKINH